MKSSYIKFHENSSSESRVVPRGQADGRTDIAKPIAAFRNKKRKNKGQTKTTGNMKTALLGRPVVITSLGQSQTVGQ